jgi:hypothetical protein
MLRIRIVAAAAATAILVVLAQSGAAAQAASADQAGQPLSLLQPAKHIATTPAAAHADDAGTAGKIKKVAGKKHSKIAAAPDADTSADAPQSTASADAWLAASATPANSAPASRPADNASASQSDNAQPDTGPLPRAVVVGGQTVQVASADQVNEIDLAADNTPPNAPPMESTAPPSDRTDVMVAADAMAQAAMAKATMAEAPPRAAFVAPSPTDAGQNAGDQNASAAENASAQETSAVGSASWIAQVLAALGGAIAAGAVAWFLIGSGPQRMYG